MHIQLRFVFLVTLPTASLATAMAAGVESFKFGQVWKDYLPSYGVIDDVSGVRSSSACAKTFTTKYRSQGGSAGGYGYNRGSRTCRIFSGQGMTVVPSPGFSYYLLKEEDALSAEEATTTTAPTVLGTTPTTPVSTESSGATWWHSTCVSDSDCQAANAECRAGMCQCETGYHYRPGPGTCLTTCATYGSTFEVFPNSCISGYNTVEDRSGKTIEECKAFCIAHNCRSFDYSFSLCFLSNTTKAEVPSAWRSSCGNHKYFERNCA